MKILIVEDEKKLSDSIVSYLSGEKYFCEQAFTYSEALAKVRIYDYDCILLDLMLPGGNGLDVLREIRRCKNPAGVIIVSVKDSVDDKVAGLKIGADDYLAKPFHLAELSVRIYAVIRRREFAANNTLSDSMMPPSKMAMWNVWPAPKYMYITARPTTDDINMIDGTICDSFIIDSLSLNLGKTLMPNKQRMAMRAACKSVVCCLLAKAIQMWLAPQ